mmetsp:Transcript_97706/g.258018  ORF Transcript_97706/g.258018 Transcript_97706/m.258018 type:complete len:267 (-) Transcript_97706:443-1243(-)
MKRREQDEEEEAGQRTSPPLGAVGVHTQSLSLCATHVWRSHGAEPRVDARQPDDRAQHREGHADGDEDDRTGRLVRPHLAGHEGAVGGHPQDRGDDVDEKGAGGCAAEVDGHRVDLVCRSACQDDRSEQKKAEYVLEGDLAESEVPLRHHACQQLYQRLAHRREDQRKAAREPHAQRHAGGDGQLVVAGVVVQSDQVRSVAEGQEANDHGGGHRKEAHAHCQAHPCGEKVLLWPAQLPEVLGRVEVHEEQDGLDAQELHSVLVIAV